MNQSNYNHLKDGVKFWANHFESVKNRWGYVPNLITHFSSSGVDECGYTLSTEDLIDEYLKLSIELEMYEQSTILKACKDCIKPDAHHFDNTDHTYEVVNNSFIKYTR